MRNIVAICLIIASYYFVYYLFLGFVNPIPAPGDSWDYHIPISKAILDGSFLHPNTHLLSKQYFPGSSEAINSIFLLFHIPLTVSNLFAILVLAICCYKLALTFHLKRDYALLFALTFVTLNAVVRWMNAVSIDIWIAIYFILLIILLEKPKKNILYFIQLGFLSGMLIGSKYNAVVYLIVLSIFYIRSLMPFIRIGRIIAFLIPFSLFGLFWYIRNYLYLHNPVYPIPIFGLPGEDIFGSYTMWNVGLKHPLEMVNAFYGEYKFWILSVFIAFGVLIRQFVIKKDFHITPTTKLFLIGSINFLLFLGFPTSEQTWIMVSSFRYSLPTFIPLILGVFLLFEKYKKEELLGYIAVASMINVLSMIYYPKLLIIYLPLALIIMYYFSKKK